MDFDTNLLVLFDQLLLLDSKLIFDEVGSTYGVLLVVYLLNLSID